VRLHTPTLVLAILGTSVGVHSARAQTATANPHGALDISCTECHSVENWTPLRDPLPFKHERTGYKLVGAHATLACRSCHESLNFSLAKTDCWSCHKVDFENAQAPPHQQFSTNCGDCHQETAWKPARFDHNQTGFQLLGAHRTADCVECHREGFAGTPIDCFACHEADFTGAVDPPHDELSTNCRDCHQETAWQPARFDHNQTAFPLRGAHRTVDCVACHRTGYAGTPTDCFACHESDYRGAKDPDHSGFPTSCESCHGETAWQPASFDHAQTSFPLRGAHRAVACIDCHRSGYAGTPTDCYSCHAPDYQGAKDPDHAGFPRTCQDCHSQSAWRPADFDHNKTAFPLTGAHRTADCQDCHQQGYAGTPTRCVDCHRSEYDNTNDPNHQAAGFPTSCQNCHNTSNWNDADFNHSQFFPLSGPHSLACGECHVNSSSYATFECILCHDHNKADTDSHHTEVGGYTYSSSACYRCHPNGRAED
jgi:hypothetical protein